MFASAPHGCQAPPAAGPALGGRGGTDGLAESCGLDWLWLRIICHSESAGRRFASAAAQSWAKKIHNENQNNPQRGRVKSKAV
eukprot:scaffold260688_cov45-Prasinocladus_malaysianus.AAC.1